MGQSHPRSAYSDNDSNIYHKLRYQLSVDSHRMQKYILYTQLWLALRHGAPRRAALPEELVLAIVRFADLRTERTIIWNQPIDIRSNGALIAKNWFRSPPLSDLDVAKIAKFQLTTESRDQGWCSNPDQGSWSWFEVGAFPSDINDAETTLPTWRGRWKKSHYNPMSEREFRVVEGRIWRFDEDDAPAIEPGDCIIVRAAAQYPGWANRGRSARLDVWCWFEPVESIIQTRLQECVEGKGCMLCSSEAR